MRNTIFTLFFLLISVSTINAQLSGSYSIDPNVAATTQNYKDIQSAVDDIALGIRHDGGIPNGWGITSTVVFNIADGVYSSPIHINEINGTSASVEVIFQSASNDFSKVIISNSSSIEQYTLFLDNADYVTFRDLTFEGIYDDRYIQTVKIRNDADHNRFEGCQIKASIYDTDNTDFNTLNIYGTDCENNVFDSCKFIGASWSVSVDYSTDTWITNSELQNFSHGGIRAFYARSPKFINNYIHSRTGSNGYGRALDAEWCYDSLYFVSNRIEGRFTGAIHIYRQAYFSSLGNSLFANNTIATEGSNPLYGFYVRYSRNLRFYNNSVNLIGTGSNTNYGFYHYNSTSSASNNRVVGNSFVVSNGYAAYYGAQTAIVENDYNNLYTKSGTLAYWSGGRNDLAALQSASGRETNSVSVDPNYLSDTDLRNFSKDLDGQGDPNILAVLPYDQDSVLRNITTPDIGAFEFDPGTDIAVSDVSIRDGNHCPGTQEVLADLYNAGVDSLFKLTVNWSINSIAQTPFVYENDTLIPDATQQISLGTATIPSGDVSINVQISSPNDGIDLVPNNDSLTSNIITGLLGTYTIGGTNPDFDNVYNAVELLNNVGICGPVVFNIRPGVYDNDLYLEEISDASSVNTITFQSETGIAEDIIITSTDNEDVIYLSDADHFIFKNITISIDDSYNLVYFESDADSNLFDGCRFISTYDLDGSTSTSYALVYANSSVRNANTFTNNYFEGGSSGIYFQGASTGSRSKKLIITDNTFKNHTAYGIYLRYVDSVLVQNNDISVSDFENYYNNVGIYGNYCSDVKVLQNTISAVNNGIHFEYVSGSTDYPIMVANNSIVNSGSLASSTIYNSSCDTIYYLNNTVYNASLEGQTGLYFSNGSDAHVKNNNVVSETGYALYAVSTNIITELDHNNLYSVEDGEAFGYWGGLPAFKMIDWKSTTGMAEGSMSLNPEISMSDLTIDLPALDNNGDTIQIEYAVDVTGAARDNNNPDIGAYEFTAYYQLDAGIENLDAKDIMSLLPLCADTLLVSVDLVNYSNDTLSSVLIKWEAGTQIGDTLVTEKLGAGDKITVNLDSFIVVADVKYEVKVWVEDPNGSADENNDNDTIIETAYGALSGGVYTVGGTSPDIETLEDAFMHLNSGACGNDIIFSIRDGIYTGQYQLGGLFGGGDTTKITFESESGIAENVIIRSDTATEDNPYTIVLANVPNITFKNLTVEAASDYYGNAITIYSGSNHMVFDGCRFITNGFGNDNDEYALVQLNNNSNADSVVFVNNYFEGGYYNFNYIGSNSPYTQNTIFKNNTCTGSLYGVYFVYHDSLVFENNSIEAERTGTYFLFLLNESSIRNNNIIINGKSNNEDCYGIQLLNSQGSSVNERLIIANNLIAMLGNAYNSYGLYCGNLNYSGIYHNTTKTNCNASYKSYALYLNNGNDNRILNNIFVNEQEGVAAYYSQDPNNLIDTLDYNNYYSNGNYIMEISGQGYPTLSNWLFNVNLDSNSLNVNPVFISADNLKCTQPLMNDAGYPIALISEDYDGVARNAVTPDLGAFEFDALSTDAQVQSIYSNSPIECAGTIDIYAVIANVGLNPLSSLKVDWTIDGSLQTQADWTGTLNTNEKDTIYLGDFTYNAMGGMETYEFQAWSSEPSGGTDDNMLNDTLLEVVNSGVSGVFTIGSSPLADFASFTEAVDFLNQLPNVCGDVIFEVEAGEYEEYITLNEVNGVSESKRIIFRSQSGLRTDVVLFDNGDSDENGTIIFDGADYFVFENMTIRQNDQFYYVLEYFGGATHNSINNCVLQLEGTSEYIVYCDDNDYYDDYNSFTNNTFIGGNYGIYWYGYMNSAITYFEGPIVIDNNRFINQYYQAIEVEYSDSVIITNNYFTCTSTADDSYYSIYLYNDYYDGYFNISDNEFVLNNGWSALEVDDYVSSNENSLISNNLISINTDYLWDVYGMYIYEIENVDVMNNTLHIVAPNANGIYGLYNEYVYYSLFSNNSIYINANDVSYAYGAYNYYCDYLDFVNNTLDVIAPNANDIYGIYSYDGYIQTYLNNNIVLEDNGYPMFVYYDYSITEMDYNNYYSPDGVIGYYDDYSETYYSLADWQDEFGDDQNSLAVEVVFLSDTLLSTCNTTLDNKGLSLDYINTDITGAARDASTPDIGAYEFNTPTAGLGLSEIVELCPDGTIDISTSLQADSYLWSTGDTTNSFTASSIGTYTLSAGTNCGTINDTVTVVANTTGDLVIFDAYDTDAGFVFVNRSTESEYYVWDFGDTETSTLTHPIHVYADAGIYTVTLTANTETCGSESYSTIIDVIIDGIDIAETDNEISVFPNPTSGLSTINFNTVLQSDIVIQLIDNTGRVLNAQEIQSGSNQANLDLSSYSNGLYLVKLVMDNKVQVISLIKE